MTIIQATIGSFIVFLVMADCFGPSEPTALIDRLVGSCTKSKEEEEAGSETARDMPDTTTGTEKLP